jgi:hypothetical protein
MASRAEVSGFVRDASHRPVPHASVVIFPRDSQWWDDYPQLSLVRRIRRVMTDRQGHFQALMIPGEYMVAAVSDPPEFWMAPEYLATLVPAAANVVVPRGGSGTVDVTAR